MLKMSSFLQVQVYLHLHIAIGKIGRAKMDGVMDAKKVRKYWGQITYVDMLTDEILTRITETRENAQLVPPMAIECIPAQSNHFCDSQPWYRENEVGLSYYGKIVLTR